MRLCERGGWRFGGRIGGEDDTPKLKVGGLGLTGHGLKRALQTLSFGKLEGHRSSRTPAVLIIRSIHKTPFPIPLTYLRRAVSTRSRSRDTLSTTNQQPCFRYPTSKLSTAYVSLIRHFPNLQNVLSLFLAMVLSLSPLQKPPLRR